MRVSLFALSSLLSLSALSTVAAQCAGTCGNSNNQNNGKCNDVNNNCGCNWDGGDCCGPDADLSSCAFLPDGTCCLDPDYREAIPTRGTTTQGARWTDASTTPVSGRPDITEQTRAIDQETRAQGSTTTRQGDSQVTRGRTTTTARSGVSDRTTTENVRTRPGDTSTTPISGRPDAVTDPTRGGGDDATRAFSTTSRLSNAGCRPDCNPGNEANINNGKCNAVNNNCGCDWDGGDCCGDSGAADQYDSCQVLPDGTCCIDPDFVAVRTTGSTTARIVTTTGGAVTRGPPDPVRTTEENVRPIDSTSTSGFTGRPDVTEPGRATDELTREIITTTPRANSACQIASCQGNENNSGNGKCNNPNNNCACSWDGGDCCGPAQSSTQYDNCDVNADGDCCLDETYRAGGSTTTRRAGGSTTTRAGPDVRTTAPPDVRTVPDTTTTEFDGGRVSATDRTRGDGSGVTREPGTTTGRGGSFSCADTCSGNTGNIGNGKCNNVNNNCGCSWDGGDCCGAAQDQGQYTSCTVDPETGDCCLDPTFRADTTTIDRGGPGDRTTAGNDVRTVPVSTTEIPGTGRATPSVATRDPNEVTRVTLSTTGRISCADSCAGNEANIGNGKCNNVNNNCGCSWDGGDCCGPAQTQGQYTACETNANGDCCLDPTYRGEVVTDAITGTTTGYFRSTFDLTTGTTTTRSKRSVSITTGTTTTTAGVTGSTNPLANIKFIKANRDSCTSKFSCLGTTCDNVLIKSSADIDYTFLENKWGCDCSGCGTNIGLSVGIPIMVGGPN